MSSGIFIESMCHHARIFPKIFQGFCTGGFSKGPSVIYIYIYNEPLTNDVIKPEPLVGFEDDVLVPQEVTP